MIVDRTSHSVLLMLAARADWLVNLFDCDETTAQLAVTALALHCVSILHCCVQYHHGTASSCASYAYVLGLSLICYSSFLRISKLGRSRFTRPV